MNKLLLTLCGAFAMLATFAQNSEPAEKVQAGFIEKFASSESVKWKHENNVWEATFKNNGRKTSAKFSETGVWFETGWNIKKKEMPAAVLKSILEQFKDFDIIKIRQIDIPDFNGYEIELIKEDTEVVLLSSMDGDLEIKKFKNKGSKEDDGEGDDDDDDDDDDDE